MKFLLAFIASFFLMSSAMADGHYDDSYDEYRICKIKAEISIERLYYTKAQATSFCKSLHKTFERGCSIRNLGYGRGWGAFYSNEWIFEGKGRSWKRAKQLAFSKYATFADRFGWGKSFPHTVYFSKCSS
jgi:hypothetical protein